MDREENIPLLTDLIEKGVEIDISELGLDDSSDLILEADLTEPRLFEPDTLSENSDLEQSIRRILDYHMELAWQEIKLAIKKETNTNITSSYKRDDGY